MPLKIADKEFTSRLFTGTGKFASNQLMEDAILASESQLVTVALKRVNIRLLLLSGRPDVERVPCYGRSTGCTNCTRTSRPRERFS